MRTVAFGTQPGRAVLRDRGIPVTRAAADLGLTYPELRGALLGKWPPSQRVRDRLPDYVDVPLVKLFTPESLTTPRRRAHGETAA